jgi:hypothetical protein
MATIVETPVGGVYHRSMGMIVIRDGRTGEVKETHPFRNMKVYGTVNALISALTNSGGGISAVYLGLGSGPDVLSADTALSGEVLSRTVGRLSHDANSPTWSLSWSYTDSPATYSIGQAGIFNTYTGALMFLKASFARVIKNSQDLLYVSWTQSLASA